MGCGTSRGQQSANALCVWVTPEHDAFVADLCVLVPNLEADKVRGSTLDRQSRACKQAVFVVTSEFMSDGEVCGALTRCAKRKQCTLFVILQGDNGDKEEEKLADMLAQSSHVHRLKYSPRRHEDVVLRLAAVMRRRSIPQPPADPFIFVSYSLRDRDVVHTLLHALESVRPALAGRFWMCASGLVEGDDDWDEQLSSALYCCSCAIVCLSPSFFASPSCMKEMKILKRRVTCHERIWLAPVKMADYSEAPADVVDVCGSFPLEFSEALYAEGGSCELDLALQLVESMSGDLSNDGSRNLWERASSNSLTNVFVVGRRPCGVSFFRGRETEAARLTELLCDTSSATISVTGHAGQGKSSLVDHVLGEIERASVEEASPAVCGIAFVRVTPLLNIESVFSTCCELLGDEDTSVLGATSAVSDRAKCDMLLARMLAVAGAGCFVLFLDNIDCLLSPEGTFDGPAMAFKELYNAVCEFGHNIPLKIVDTSRITPQIPAHQISQRRVITLSEGLSVEDCVAVLRDLDADGDGGLRDAPEEELRLLVDAVCGLPRALEESASLLCTDPFSSLGALLETLRDNSGALRMFMLEHTVQHERTARTYKSAHTEHTPRAHARARTTGGGGDLVTLLAKDAFNSLDAVSRRILECLAVLQVPVPVAAVDFMLRNYVAAHTSRSTRTQAIVRRLARTHFVHVDRKSLTVALLPLDAQLIKSQLDSGLAAGLHTAAADYYASIQESVVWETMTEEHLTPYYCEINHRIAAGDYDGAARRLVDVDPDGDIPQIFPLPGAPGPFCITVMSRRGDFYLTRVLSVFLNEEGLGWRVSKPDLAALLYIIAVPMVPGITLEDAVAAMNSLGRKPQRTILCKLELMQTYCFLGMHAEALDLGAQLNSLLQKVLGAIQWGAGSLIPGKVSPKVVLMGVTRISFLSAMIYVSMERYEQAREAISRLNDLVDKHGHDKGFGLHADDVIGHGLGILNSILRACVPGGSRDLAREIEEIPVSADSMFVMALDSTLCWAYVRDERCDLALGVIAKIRTKKMYLCILAIKVQTELAAALIHYLVGDLASATAALQMVFDLVEEASLRNMKCESLVDLAAIGLRDVFSAQQEGDKLREAAALRMVADSRIVRFFMPVSPRASLLLAHADALTKEAQLSPHDPAGSHAQPLPPLGAAQLIAPLRPPTLGPLSSLTFSTHINSQSQPSDRIPLKNLPPVKTNLSPSPIANPWHPPASPQEPADEAEDWFEGARYLGPALRWEVGRGIMASKSPGSEPWQHTAATLADSSAVLVTEITVASKHKDDLEWMVELTTLQHDNIVRVHTVMLRGNTMFVVSDYVVGGHLARVIQELQGVPEKTCASFVRQICCGLEYLHALGIAHLDLRCTNVMVCEKVLKLTNVSLARLVGQEGTFGSANPSEDIIGSAEFMAPELVVSNAISTACDVWSLGCTAVEIVTGKPPWCDRDCLSLFAALGGGGKPALPDGCSSEFADFLDNCFERDPKHRWTIEEVQRHSFLAPD